MEDSGYILELKHISKSFPGVKALDDVSFAVRPGRVHALMGENGAGKSTLMKCAFGIYQPDLIFFIDIPEEEGLARKKKQKKLDRLEQESIDFHHMVSEGDRKVLCDRPEVIRIDGCLSVEEIHQEIRKYIEEEADE